MSKIAYLAAEDILNVHSVVVSETGGSHGVRDKHALLMLEEMPRQVAFGKELYPTLHLKAALYVRSVIASHPFVDGNKRSAMACADVFLHMNGYRLSAPQGGVEAFALSVIAEKLDLEAIAVWLKENSERI